MRRLAGILVIGMALFVGGCEDVDIDPFDDDSAPAAAQANGCTPQGCPQAPQFCQARGYQPGTDGYQRCIVSVEENLRKGGTANGVYPH